MPGQNAPDEKPEHRRRQGHDHIVNAEPEQAPKQDRAAAEPVGKIAEDRREQKLHQRVGEHQPAADQRRIAHERGAARADRNLADQFRQHRYDDAEPDHIHRDGDQDEHQRSFGRGWPAGRWVATGWRRWCVGRWCGVVHDTLALDLLEPKVKPP
jgi:hypothetical protein